MISAAVPPTGLSTPPLDLGRGCWDFDFNDFVFNYIISTRPGVQQAIAEDDVGGSFKTSSSVQGVGQGWSGGGCSKYKIDIIVSVQGVLFEWSHPSKSQPVSIFRGTRTFSSNIEKVSKFTS